MAELSTESGVPVATVKYYLREGLLPAGERTSPNQARYAPEHVQRLKLIRALTDVGGLSLASVGAVLAAIEDEAVTPHEALGVVQDELAGDPPETPEGANDWAFEALADVIRSTGGGELERHGRTVENLVATMSAIRALGHKKLIEHLEDYARLAMDVAEIDLGTLRGLESVDRIIETALVATVLGDRLFAGLRHVAQETISGELFDRNP